MTIDFLDLVSVVLIFNKLDARLDGAKSAGENQYRVKLRLCQPSRIERLRLDVGLDLITPSLIGALFGARILESTPAFGIYYLAIAPPGIPVLVQNLKTNMGRLLFTDSESCTLGSKYGFLFDPSIRLGREN